MDRVWVIDKGNFNFLLGFETALMFQHQKDAMNYVERNKEILFFGVDLPMYFLRQVERYSQKELETKANESLSDWDVKKIDGVIEYFERFVDLYTEKEANEIQKHIMTVCDVMEAGDKGVNDLLSNINYN